MIAQLFYPRELKDAIKDLREKNDLNEEALANLNKQPLVVFITFLVMIVLFVTTGGQTGLYVSLAVFFIALILIPFLVRNTYSSHMAAYLNGHQKKGKAIKVYFTSPDFPVKTVVVQPDNGGEIFKLKPGSVWSRKYSGGPSQGEAIQYFESVDSKYKNVPNTQEVKKIFCLSKKILEEKNMPKEVVPKNRTGC